MSFSPATLHITNGDMAVKNIQDAGVEGTILPWRDVLHEGPVPFGMSLEELSEVRIKYIASRGWNDESELRDWFHYRDKMLTGFREYEQLVLWFEHDLYDQLQLIQILAYLATRDLHNYPLKIICTEHYLGMQSTEGINDLINEIDNVSFEQIAVATTAWQVLSLNTPVEWFNLLQANTECLPFLKDSIMRLLQEYPDFNTGLTKTQLRMLEIVEQAGSIPAGKLFASYQQTEERRFMGDVIFWGYLSALLEGENALLKLPEEQALTVDSDKIQHLSLTEKGQQVLSRKIRWPGIDEVDRWIGGVHLTQKDCWFWDNEHQKLVHHKVN